MSTNHKETLEENKEEGESMAEKFLKDTYDVNFTKEDRDNPSGKTLEKINKLLMKINIIEQSEEIKIKSKMVTDLEESREGLKEDDKEIERLQKELEAEIKKQKENKVPKEQIPKEINNLKEQIKNLDDVLQNKNGEMEKARDKCKEVKTKLEEVKDYLKKEGMNEEMIEKELYNQQEILEKIKNPYLCPKCKINFISYYYETCNHQACCENCLSKPSGNEKFKCPKCSKNSTFLNGITILKMTDIKSKDKEINIFSFK
ncbi:MAG: hypothetical protein MJ252_02590 [archaeon]|nr:hypothetical protein [archaeon]